MFTIFQHKLKTNLTECKHYYYLKKQQYPQKDIAYL